MNDDGIRQLRSAIILQAVKDYRSARRKLANPKTKGNSRLQAERDLKECERFFLSDWFNFWSDGYNGKRLLEILRKENYEQKTVKKQDGRIRG